MFQWGGGTSVDHIFFQFTSNKESLKRLFLLLLLLLATGRQTAELRKVALASLPCLRLTCVTHTKAAPSQNLTLSDRHHRTAATMCPSTRQCLWDSRPATGWHHFSLMWLRVGRVCLKAANV